MLFLQCSRHPCSVLTESDLYLPQVLHDDIIACNVAWFKRLRERRWAFLGATEIATLCIGCLRIVTLHEVRGAQRLGDSVDHKEICLVSNSGW
jgi:hypothetical protein